MPVRVTVTWIGVGSERFGKSDADDLKDRIEIPSKLDGKSSQTGSQNRSWGGLGGIWRGLGRSWVGLGGPGPSLIEKVGSLALRWPSLAPHLGPPNRPKSIKNRCQDACKFCISFRIDFWSDLGPI